MQSSKSKGQFKHAEINYKIYTLQTYGLTDPNYRKPSVLNVITSFKLRTVHTIVLNIIIIKLSLLKNILTLRLFNFCSYSII